MKGHFSIGYFDFICGDFSPYSFYEYVYYLLIIICNHIYIITRTKQRFIVTENVIFYSKNAKETTLYFRVVVVIVVEFVIRISFTPKRTFYI